ncbi:MAG: hypothetical protein M1331_00605 [Candidatus Marsarchaeota archaeon]|nr:hypothetical protein [Candidatus Marsarchaeota archaeon]
MPTSVRGIVSCANHIDGEYTIFSDKPINVKSNIVLELYDIVSFDGIAAAESGMYTPDIITIEGRSSKQELAGRIAQYVHAATELLGFSENRKNMLARLQAMVKTEAVLKIFDALELCAAEFIQSFFSGSPIIIRFHNDGDGVSGGLAVYSAMMRLQEIFVNKNIFWEMQRTISYDPDSYINDDLVFSNYDSAEKPLLIIIDFGSSDASIPQINDAVKKYKLIWLDHHIYGNIPLFDSLQCYINSWNFGGDSNITAGLIAGVFSSFIADAGIGHLIDASLVSDHSTYAPNSASASEASTVLDFITGTRAYSSMGIGEIYRLVNDSAKMHEMYEHAENTFNEQIEIGLSNLKIHSNGDMRICTLNFDKIKEENRDYILPGRYSSKLQDVISAKYGNAVTIVYYNRFISVRISKGISERIGLISMLNGIKNSFSDVESCGGHAEAASIKMKNPDEGPLMTVVRELIKQIQSKAAQG